MAKIRQEINIISTLAGGASGIVLSEYGYILLDPTKYSGTVSYYFEAVVATAHAANTLSLRISGTTTDHASVSVASTGLVRAAFSTTPSSATEYGIFSASTTVRIESARIIIIQEDSPIESTQTQIEIGNTNFLKSNITLTEVTSGKYWRYTAANWSGTKTFYVETCSWVSNAMGNYDIVLQEDDGVFGTWTTISTFIDNFSNLSITRTRASFTPTDGRNYRLASVISSDMYDHEIRGGKIIIDQTDSAITALELDYLVTNTTISATGLQASPTFFDVDEWSGVTNVYKHVMHGRSSTSSSKLVKLPSTDITDSTLTGLHLQVSPALTLTDDSTIDVNIIVTGVNVALSKILVQTTISTSSAALTGTITSSATETDIVAGGKTIILTLTGDTWVASGGTFDGQRQNIINGLDSAQSEANGWDAVVKAGQGVSGVVRTSDTVVTITLDAFASYNITAIETITATIPSTALTGATQLVATPTFTVSQTTIARRLGLLGVG